MFSSITPSLYPPLLSRLSASHSSRLSEKLSPSKTLDVLSVCGGFHHCDERRLHCRASISSVFVRQGLPLFKKNKTHQNSFLMIVSLSVYSCMYAGKLKKYMSTTHSVSVCVCVCVFPSSFSCEPCA